MTHKNLGQFLSRVIIYANKKCKVSDNLLGLCSVYRLHVATFRRNIIASVFRTTVQVVDEGILRINVTAAGRFEGFQPIRATEGRNRG